MLREKRRRRLARAHDRMRDEPAQEGQIRRHALDARLGERGHERAERFVTGRPVGDQLRDHRVVREADLVALLDAGVDPHRAAWDTVSRQLEPLDPAGLREEVLGSSA